MGENPDGSFYQPWQELSARLATFDVDSLIAPARHSAFVRHLVDEAFAITRRFLEPSARFDVEHVESRIPKREPDDPRGPVEERVVSATVAGDVLREDQLVAARYWGIAFDAPARDQELLDRHIALAADFWFTTRLGQISKLDRQPAFVPPSFDEGRDLRSLDFERLIIDILNEHIRCASQAPLPEDMLEETDVRLRLPSLQRERGARVQVTRTHSATSHVAKLDRLRHFEELVVVSPRALAIWLSSPEVQWHVEATDLATVRAALPDPRAPDAAATALRTMLERALDESARSPRGPMANLPPALRSFIRTFAVLEATRSTASMRRKQGRHAGQRPSR